MKKLFWAAAALLVLACGKTPDPELQKISTDGIPGSIKKIFVLSEGGMGSNNASLDMWSMDNGLWYQGVFKKANPSLGAELGDVGNDIAVHGDEVWIVVNNSGIVEVISASTHKEITSVSIPMPRNIAFDDKYAYVSSWAGAFATYDENYVLVDSNNPKGKVYRVDLVTKKVDGSVEVGYQPEGLAVSGGNLYVANSGGIASQTGAGYDNTLSVIDCATFRVLETIEIAPNLQKVFVTDNGRVYVTCFGDYYSVHSGLYMIDGTAVKKIADYVSVATCCGNSVYCIGSEKEWDYSATDKEYYAWSSHDGFFSAWNFDVSKIVTPYGLCVIDSNGEGWANAVLVADAGDYFNPGSVTYYYKGTFIGKAVAGVCPGHFAIW